MFWLDVERNAAMPLIRQIYERLRLKILRGELRAGEDLPSSRELARHLHISRNVVLEAYAQLTAEGYLESRSGSGTYVAEGACMEPPAPLQSPAESPSDAAAAASGDLIDFRTGVPALDLLPRKILGRRFRELCASAPDAFFDYGKPEGSGELRRTLSRYLARTRGVLADPECILVTTGAAEALYLAARLLHAEKGEVVVEDPVHVHFQETLRSCGAELVPIGVDEHGMRTDELRRTDCGPAFVFVTPSHQFPLGGTLPVQRRIELLRFVERTGCLVVEDDYESEYRFGGTAVSSLQGMAPDRVVYIGTFSKILSPAIRIGYLALPARLVRGARTLKYVVDNHSPGLEQLVLAHMLESGEMERHAAEMKRIYRRRRETLIHELEASFPDRCAVLGSAAGLHVVASFRDIRFTPDVTDALEREGVRVHPVERHAIRKGLHEHEAILGYGNLSESRIRDGVARMRRVLNALARGSREDAGA